MSIDVHPCDLQAEFGFYPAAQTAWQTTIAERLLIQVVNWKMSLYYYNLFNKIEYRCIVSVIIIYYVFAVSLCENAEVSEGSFGSSSRTSSA